MKKDAILVNIARGGIVDEAALIKHLSAGHLILAEWRLDVCENELLKPGDPLWTTPRDVITPHCGSFQLTAKDD